ncbi:MULTISPECIES: gluconokinase [unclassified Embleya]|uniref:gluconokinase n=1 Tax=unclassified Embleya TaxID=2699296 RepID=UPI0033D02EEC
MNAPQVVVVMGVSGTGKSTVGRLLAAELRVPYADADDFHPPANIAKMSAGIPLDDVDRAPWLDSIGEWLAAHARSGGVVGCSALKRAYRDRLRRVAPEVVTLHLVGDRALIAARLHERTGHFMPETLLDSQFADLQALEPDERGLALDVAPGPDAITEQAVAALRGLETNQGIS